jgi:membrane protein YdbS with pleckstrin-like domain
MFSWYRRWILHWLKVPAEPHPPFGDPASLRVFRAGRNYFRLRLFGWALGELLALAGIIFWVVVFFQIETGVRLQKEALAHPAVVAAPATPAAAGDATPPASPKRKKARTRSQGWDEFKRTLYTIAARLPDWSFPVIWAIKLAGFLLYLAQIPVTYAIRRLDYEMRWYVVTDRSLRIRTGVWRVQELTMSFANLQQVEVTQGPVQRLLGLADVRVQSAGGGGGQAQQHSGRPSLHLGHFHGVDNAVEIRDLILDRLRRFRESGLGDPEEIRRAYQTAGAATGDPSALLGAARELRDAARDLRTALR